MRALLLVWAMCLGLQLKASEDPKPLEANTPGRHPIPYVVLCDVLREVRTLKPLYPRSAHLSRAEKYLKKALDAARKPKAHKDS